MKITKLKLAFTILIWSMVANITIAQNTDYDKLKDKIKKDFNTWLIKGEYEKNSDFETRIKNQALAKFHNIIIENIEKAKKTEIKKSYCATLEKYNPENESFILIWKNRGNNSTDTAYIQISSKVAPEFGKIGLRRDQTYKQPTIYVIPTEISMINNTWRAIQTVIIFDNFWTGSSGEQFEKIIKEKGIYSYEFDHYGVKKYLTVDLKKIKSPTDIVKDVYFYEWKPTTMGEIQPLNFNYQDLNITLPEFK